MKPRFFIFVVIGIIAVIAVAGLIASQPSKPRTSKTPGIALVTINADIGIEQIYIINLSTGGANTKTFMDLPYSFNCSAGNTIQLYGYTQEGYVFVTWESEQLPGSFQDDNPLTFKVGADCELTGKVKANYGGYVVE